LEELFWLVQSVNFFVALMHYTIHLVDLCCVFAAEIITASSSVSVLKISRNHGHQIFQPFTTLAWAVSLAVRAVMIL